MPKIRHRCFLFHRIANAKPCFIKGLSHPLGLLLFGHHRALNPITCLARDREVPGIIVLHKCANPACPVSFRDINMGKLFFVEIDSSSSDKKTRHRSRMTHQHYWLCDECSRTFTLVFEKERGIISVPLINLAARASNPPTPRTGINRTSERIK